MYCDCSLTYWLSEPSTSRPKSPATRQRLPDPRRHWSQRPQAMMGLMMTCCPGFTSDTPSPSESITPVDSWPITTGYLTPGCSPT